MQIPPTEEFRILLERFAAARWVEWSRLNTAKADAPFDFKLTEHGEERVRLLARMLLSELHGISDGELLTLKKLLVFVAEKCGGQTH
jgi:hypothetical protein